MVRGFPKEAIRYVPRCEPAERPTQFMNIGYGAFSVCRCPGTRSAAATAARVRALASPLLCVAPRRAPRSRAFQEAAEAAFQIKDMDALNDVRARCGNNSKVIAIVDGYLAQLSAKR